MDPADRAGVPLFRREFLGAEETFTRIGDGALGGKAAGLDRMRRAILDRLDPGEFPGIRVAVPTLTVLGTEVFDAFMEQNDLWEVVDDPPADERLAHAFQQADLPARWVGDLRALVTGLHCPLAVRSSSLLEDALEHPFAGVYATKMTPNNQPDADARFRRLAEAVKFVWASTFFAAARSYQASVGRSPRDEKMAVVIQEIVGRRRGHRWYPTISGVARSWNYYPSGHATPEDGVAHLALGLGRQIVDGGACWTYSPAWPRTPVYFKDEGDLLKNTQTRFWAVNMGKAPPPDPTRETEYLVELDLAEAEYDDALRHLASTWDAAANRLRPGIARPGPRVLDFAPLLRGGALPLNDLVKRLLDLSREALDAAVEIEFALDVAPGKGETDAVLGFLQARPMAVAGGDVDVCAEELRGDDLLLASEQALGDGVNEDLTDVVYLKPDAFATEHTPRIAREVAAVNADLVAAGRNYLLIGFGRWGSTDPWLGVPVDWGQISGARVIVEATLPELYTDMSQGSHFFHNLISFRVLYLPVPHRGGPCIDWDWLARQETAAETDFVRHVRTRSPLRVKVDGRSGRGVVKYDAEEGP